MKTLSMKESKLKKEASRIIGWRSPSNIALVKYWGKHGDQLPNNPSISFTLSNAYTETIVQYDPLEYTQDKISTNFYFDGKPNEAFQLRIDSFINKHLAEFDFLRKVQLSIESRNSFPHSSGIASSASSMSALVLCLLSLEQKIKGETKNFLQRASRLSRLASGSASRSVFPHVALWGNCSIEGSSNDYAIPLPSVDSVFKSFHDDILIVSAEEKAVSSSAGHQLMVDNPYGNTRYERANRHIIETEAHLKNGNIDALGEIIENEALELHALMMCSRPSYILMEPNTLAIIAAIRKYRKQNKQPIYFTLDAGPNVHVLYPDEIKNEAETFVNESLLPLCIDNKIIRDKVGEGPQMITEFSI